MTIQKHGALHSNKQTKPTLTSKKRIYAPSTFSNIPKDELFSIQATFLAKKLESSIIGKKHSTKNLINHVEINEELQSGDPGIGAKTKEGFHRDIDRESMF
jgi:hypothetical protein